MRALAIERAFRCAIFPLMAAGVFKVSGSRERLQHALEQDIPLLKPLANQIGWDPENSKLVRHIAHAFALSSSTLQWIAVGLAAYALIELIEAVGLWLMKRWGEYFAVIATSVFLPLEIYELTEKITAMRLIALAGQHRRGDMAAVEQAVVRPQRRRRRPTGRNTKRKAY